MIVGVRSLGRVDVVPHVGHVATRFLCVFMLPVLPLGSYLVTGEFGDDANGYRIGLSLKSIASAYLRAALTAWAVLASATAGTGLVQAVMIATGGAWLASIVGFVGWLALAAAGFAGLCCVGLGMFAYGRVVNRASPEREQELLAVAREWHDPAERVHAMFALAA